MKYQSRKKPSNLKKSKKNPRFVNGDSAFEPDLKRRRDKDEDLESLSSDDEDRAEDEDRQEEPVEAAAEVKYRTASEYLERIRAAAKRVEEEEKDDDDGEEREEVEGRRDSMIADILQKSQLEESGRVRRLLASRVLKPEPVDEFRLLVKHRHSVTSVALSADDTRGFSASKDGIIVHWDVESGKAEKYLWPNEVVLISHHAKAPQNPSAKRMQIALHFSWGAYSVGSRSLLDPDSKKQSEHICCRYTKICEGLLDV